MNESAKEIIRNAVEVFLGSTISYFIMIRNNIPTTYTILCMLLCVGIIMAVAETIVYFGKRWKQTQKFFKHL